MRSIAGAICLVAAAIGLNASSEMASLFVLLCAIAGGAIILIDSIAALVRQVEKDRQEA